MICGTISAPARAVRLIRWPLRQQFSRRHRRWHRQLSQMTPGGKSLPRPGPSAWTGARRLCRRPVMVLASVVIAGLIGMVLAVTVGVASVQHLAGAPASARPGHSISGTVAGPPARRPSSASPSHSARPGTSPGDTGTVRVVVSNHRSTAGFVSGRERIHRHRHGSDTGQGHGNGNRRGHGNGHGEGNGNGHGNGHGQGNGTATATGTATARATGTRRSSAFQVSRLAEMLAGQQQWGLALESADAPGVRLGRMTRSV